MVRPRRPQVLVVGDDAHTREHLTGLLVPEFDVRAVPDGEQALALARATHPELIVADGPLPDLGESGLVTALRSDPAFSAVAVILVCPGTGREAAIRSLAGGVDDYLVKPFADAELLARVRTQVRMSRLRRGEASWRAALTAAIPDGFFVVDPDGSVVEINDGFADILGYGEEGMPYRPPYPWWPDPDHDPAADVLRDTRSGAGRPGEYAVPRIHRDGHEIWLHITHATATDPESGQRWVVGTIRDVSARKRTERADALLARAGAALAEPGRLEERLHAVLEAAVPDLGALGVVALLGPDGRVRPAAAVCPTDPDLIEAGDALPPLTLPASLRAPLSRGESVLVRGSGETGLREVVAGEQLADRLALGLQDRLLVGLATNGRLLGVLEFAGLLRHGQVRTYEPDHALATELGRRLTLMLEADRLARREHQLNQASSALAAAISAQDAAEQLAIAVTDSLATAGVAVYLLDPAAPRRLHLAHHTGVPAEYAEQSGVVDLDGSHAVADAARANQPSWVADTETWAALYPGCPIRERIPTAQAMAALPLVLAGETIGALLMTFSTNRDFPNDEREFTTTLLHQAAQAFERATLTDNRWHASQTLQQHLLPRRIPDIEQLGLAVHYQPASSIALAGGDWYDIIELSEDKIAIAVGDVVGNGATAAGVMGQLRAALMGFLLEGHTCGRALELLSAVAERIDGAIGSTAVCVILDVVTGEMSWAGAGHPPPLILDPHRAEPAGRYLAGATNIVLGVRRSNGPGIDRHGPVFTEATTTLPVGASVLLYTDGLIERPRESLDAGFTRVAESTGAHPAAPPRTLLDTALHAAFVDVEPHDDVAVVVARRLASPLRRRLPATPDQLRPLRRAIATWADQAAVPERLVQDLQLALVEAVSNSIEHAYPPDRPGEFTFDVRQLADGSLRAEVTDHGCWQPPSEDSGYRGRGLAMIRGLSEQRMHLEPGERGTRVTFTLPNPPPDSHADAEARTRGGDPGARHEPARLVVTSQPDRTRLLSLSGDLDLATAEPLRVALLAQVHRATEPVVLDLAGVTHLASAGVRLLASTLRTCPIPPQVRIPPGCPAHRVLVLTGLDQLYEIHATTGPANRHADASAG